MEIQTIENYIHTTKLELDVVALENSCHIMYDFIKEYLSHSKKDYDGQATLTTSLFKQYNLLLYPLPGFHELYEKIREVFHLLDDKPNEKYFIQCWLNIYRKGEYINWHSHWDPEYKSWHGFYCLTGEGSHTTYRLPPNQKEVEVPTIIDQIVISKSDGDWHRSSEWNKDSPRITIAFDIVPGRLINPLEIFNHWIPI